MNLSDNLPKRDRTIPRVRVTAAELAAIRKLYGPLDLSHNIRLRLLKASPGRPRRAVTVFDPQVQTTINACLSELESISRTLAEHRYSPALAPFIAATLAAIEKHLITMIDAHQIPADDDRLPARRPRQ